MIVNAHCHVFTFNTFLTQEAKRNLKMRLERHGLSEAWAAKVVDCIQQGMAEPDGHSLPARVLAFLQSLGTSDLSAFEFLRFGCLHHADAVTDELMQDMALIKERPGVEAEDAIVTPLMLDVVAEDAPPQDKALFAVQYDQTVRQARRYPGLVLPFVAVNPKRGPQALEIMRQALTDGACLGVKLYPSLGYSAADPMMDAVFEACQELGAPITMHCNSGGFCAPGYAHLNGCPGDWKGLLEKYDAVRLNFAHFGDEDIFTRPEEERYRWKNMILDMMDACPGRVFADVSFQDGPLGPPAVRGRYFDWLLQQLRTETRRSQILWGTDFYMINLAQSQSAYWELFRRELGPDFCPMASDNARRFLGLPTDGEAVDADSAVGRHIAYLRRNREAEDFATGSAPAKWLKGRL